MNNKKSLNISIATKDDLNREELEQEVLKDFPDAKMFYDKDCVGNDTFVIALTSLYENARDVFDLMKIALILSKYNLTDAVIEEVDYKSETEDDLPTQKNILSQF